MLFSTSSSSSSSSSSNQSSMFPLLSTHPSDEVDDPLTHFSTTHDPDLTFLNASSSSYTSSYSSSSSSFFPSSSTTSASSLTALATFSTTATLNATGLGGSWCWNNESSQPDAEGEDQDFHHQFYETSQFITGLILYPCICLPGLLGNALTLLVLSHKNMRTSTNAFLSALAVSDSIKLLNDLLYFCTILLLRTDDVLGNRAYGYLYPYAHFVFNMSVCVSSWLTVSVAVERYFLVCQPTRARRVCSRRRAVTVCAGVYLVMTALALPSAFRYRTVECQQLDTGQTMLRVELTRLWQHPRFVLGYTWTQNLLRSIIPLLVLVALNTRIIGAVRKTRANRQNSSRHRVTVMMVIVILVFLVCITPDAVMSTAFGQGYTEAGLLVRGIREVTDTLLAVNAASNFVIYCLFNRIFLAGCRGVFCGKSQGAGGRVGWQTEMDESQYKRLSEGLKSLTVTATASNTLNLNNNSDNDVINGSSPGL